MSEKSNHPTPAKSAKKLGQFSGEPIFIPLEREENPPPAETPAWPKYFFIGGLILALLCAWQFAPSATKGLWQNFIQLFPSAGQ
jgi:hypothetical protein